MSEEDSIRKGYLYIRGQKVIPPKERILSLIEIDLVSECWNWKGALKGRERLRRYGTLTVGSRLNKTRRTVAAHRYSYEVFVGSIPKGLFVCHHCDNPSCVNPNHLFVGTYQDNVNDRELKGRGKLPIKLRTPKELANE